MQRIELAAVPNQSFSIILDTNLFDISLKTCANVIGATIAINKQVILTNNRVVPGTPLIPYRYIENGNMILLTKDEEYADYNQFGITQFLIYASQTEIDELRT